MSAPWTDLLRISASFVEAGLTVMNSGVRTMQTGIEKLAGQKSDPGTGAPPVNGPECLDSAFSDFANRLVRIGRMTPLEPGEVVKSMGEVVQSARKSFGYLDLSSPRALLLPLAVPLSLGGMFGEAMLRAIAVSSVIKPSRMPRFVDQVAEMFSDIGVFAGVEYGKLIERYRRRLMERPDDNATRLELGHVYVKCGLHDEAVRELDIAVKNPATRALALHERAVAHYRAGRFEQAVSDGTAAMVANPGNERARAWLWLSSRSLGGYPESVPQEYRMEMKAGYEPTSIRYEDIAAKIGLDKTSAGRGTAVFDYNNDGLLDIVITAAHAGCNLYRNNGDGTFTDVSIDSGLDKCVNGFVVAAGDYDNDGFVDLFVTRSGFYVGNTTLYHNNGDGTFTDVSARAGIETWGPGFTASWVDYDCDGYLDLFIAHNLGGLLDRRVPNRLFHNNGDGTFTDVTKESGLGGSVFPTIGSAWGDYDNDGRPDLFISSGLGRPQLYRNNGDGTFAEVGVKAGLAELVIGSTCFWCDYDNDGWLDIVQFVWSDHEDVVYTMKTGHAPEGGGVCRVFHNNRDGTFSKRDRELGFDGCWGTMSGNFGDLNNDGYLDILLGNGSPRMDRLEPLILLENDGRKFHNVTFSAGLPFVGKSHGTNCADLFGDGRLSVLVAAGGAYPGDLLTSSVYCPKERGGNYLNVRLTGTKSNRDAIGARLTLISGDARQTREVGGGTNFGCLPCEQHFGLADRTQVEALEIRWPSGLRQRVENPPVNDTIRVTEGRADWESVYRR